MFVVDDKIHSIKNVSFQVL